MNIRKLMPGPDLNVLSGICHCDDDDDHDVSIGTIFRTKLL